MSRDNLLSCIGMTIREAMMRSTMAARDASVTIMLPAHERRMRQSVKKPRKKWVRTREYVTGATATASTSIETVTTSST